MDRFIVGVFYNITNDYFVLAKQCTMDYNNFLRFREYMHTGDLSLNQEEYNKLNYQLIQGRNND